MAYDGSTVNPNPGTLTWDGSAIGYTEEGIELFHPITFEPIAPEELGDSPVDYINLGGPVLAFATLWQWDAATRKAVMDYAVSGNTIVLSTTHIGKKASVLKSGTLSFAPVTTGHVNWSCTRTVVLSGHQRPLSLRFRKRRVLAWQICFGLLPPAAGGTILTFDVSA